MLATFSFELDENMNSNLVNFVDRWYLKVGLDSKRFWLSSSTVFWEKVKKGRTKKSKWENY